MKVSLLARPDHSASLYVQLKQYGVDVTYDTFYALEQGSLLQRIARKRHQVPTGANTHLLFTLLSYPIMRARLTIPGTNWRRIEESIGDLLLRPSLDGSDIVHYWPFYFGKLVRHTKQKHPRIVTLADYYEAEPSAANAQFAGAYERAGLRFRAPGNTLIDQNAAFRFERNFVVPSEYTRQTYLRLFPEANIHVAPFGLMARRISISPRKQRRRFVFVGRVSLEKGVHILIAAARMLPDLLFDLIGPMADDQRSYFESRLREVPNVTYRGRVPHSDVERCLQEYDAFVMPSLSDAYSIAVVEAHSAGLPVVVTDHCGAADAVRKYRLGEVCAAGDEAALAAAIEAVARFGNDELAAGLLDLERDERAHPYALRVLSIYRQLLAAQPSTRSPT